MHSYQIPLMIKFTSETPINTNISSVADFQRHHKSCSVI